MLSILGILVPKRVVIYASIVLAVVGAILYIRWDAYRDGVKDTIAKYEAAIDKERKRIQKANEEATRKAAEEIAKLNKVLRARDASISELRLQANKDPNANRPAISRSSVLRLNRIRKASKAKSSSD